MRQIVFTSQYKRDLKLALRRNLPEEELNEVIKLLATDQPLMYRKDDLMLQLVLMRTGTHADLFGM